MTSLAQGYETTSLDAGARQCATFFDGSNPFMAKSASTASSTLEGLQFDIAPRIYERICEFFLSLALPSFLLETAAAHEQAWQKERRRNGSG